MVVLVIWRVWIGMPRVACREVLHMMAVVTTASAPSIIIMMMAAAIRIVAIVVQHGVTLSLELNAYLTIDELKK